MTNLVEADPAGRSGIVSGGQGQLMAGVLDKTGGGGRNGPKVEDDEVVAPADTFDPSEERAAVDDQPGLLPHLPDHRFSHGLARFNPSSRYRPHALSRGVHPGHQQKMVGHDHDSPDSQHRLAYRSRLITHREPTMPSRVAQGAVHNQLTGLQPERLEEVLRFPIAG